MKNKTYSKEFCDLFNIKFPLIQAPMAGGISIPSLVSAVVNSNVIGFLAAGYISASTLEEQILEVKANSTGTFGVNLFIVDSIKIEDCIKPKNISNIEKELGIYKNDNLNFNIDEENDKKLDLILKHKIKIVSFTFGIPSKEWIQKLKQNNIYIIGNCTNSLEAKILQDTGFDALVAQGIEAGGHRGSFLNPPKNDEIGLFSLLQELKSFIKVPIIAAGGMSSGKSILAAKILGATAIQIGTGFLLTNESGASNEYKNELLNSKAHETLLTKNISGKKARGKENILTNKLDLENSSIMSFPIQNSLTKEIRNYAQKVKDSQYMSLWCGQSISCFKKIIPAKDFIENIIEEYKQELINLS